MDFAWIADERAGVLAAIRPAIFITEALPARNTESGPIGCLDPQKSTCTK